MKIFVRVGCTFATGTVAEGRGVALADAFCACTVNATEVAMIDSLPAPHALSKRPARTSIESRDRVFFMIILSAWKTHMPK